MYTKVEMPPPRALSSSPHMLDIDDGGLLDLSTACSLPEPVQRYGWLLLAHSATLAGSFTAAPGGAKEGRATTVTTLHSRLETETLGEGPRRTLTGWKRSYQPHLNPRGYSSAIDKAWESLRRTGNATRKPGKGAALRPVSDRLGSQGGWESGGRGGNARWCLQRPMGGRQNADTPQASKGAGPGACWGLSGVLERGACWVAGGGGNSVGSAALQRASVAQRACVRVARRWPVMAQDGSSWFVQVGFLARPGLVVVFAGSSSSPSKLCHGPPYLAPAFLPIELHRRHHDVRIRPLNPSPATLRSLLWIVYSLHSTALVFLVPSPLRSPAPRPPSTRLLIPGVAAAFTCTLRLL